VYTLTTTGEAALRGWLESGGEPLYELRDEGMLKLFFSDFTEPAQRIENIRAMRARQERKLEALRAIEEAASQGSAGPYSTLQLGIGLTTWIIDWCHATERQFAARSQEDEPL
jgi:hypothetical protein